MIALLWIPARAEAEVPRSLRLLQPSPSVSAAGSAFSLTELEELNLDRAHAHRVALATLGGWGALSLGAGVVGLLTTDGGWRNYFWQMTALFSAPILASAGIGALLLRAIDPTKLDLVTSLRLGVIIERVVLLGLVLDVVTAGVGAYLLARGLRVESDRLVGYGRALLVQSAFLIPFDAVLTVLNIQYDRRLFLMIESAGRGVPAFGVSVRF